MAHKKAGGSSRNGRDSQGQRRGVKVFGGESVRAGNILVLPFEHPSIEDLQSQASDTDPIVADQPILAGVEV